MGKKLIQKLPGQKPKMLSSQEVDYYMEGKSSALNYGICDTLNEFVYIMPTETSELPKVYRACQERCLYSVPKKQQKITQRIVD